MKSGASIWPLANDRGGAGAAAPAIAPAKVTSADLLGGDRELLIEHAGGTYRLRVTRTNKLILTK